MGWASLDNTISISVSHCETMRCFTSRFIKIAIPASEREHKLYGILIVKILPPVIKSLFHAVRFKSLKRSLWCFCVEQRSHPVASWVNHICVFPMDISNSSLEASHLIHKWEPGRKLDTGTHAPQKSAAHTMWLSGCISQRVLIDLIEVSRAIHKINQGKSVAPLWSLVLVKLGPVSNNEMDFYRLRLNKSEAKSLFHSF